MIRHASSTTDGGMIIYMYDYPEINYKRKTTMVAFLALGHNSHSMPSVANAFLFGLASVAPASLLALAAMIPPAELWKPRSDHKHRERYRRMTSRTIPTTPSIQEQQGLHPKDDGTIDSSSASSNSRPNFCIR